MRTTQEMCLYSDSKWCVSHRPNSLTVALPTPQGKGGDASRLPIAPCLAYFVLLHRRRAFSCVYEPVPSAR